MTYFKDQDDPRPFEALTAEGLCFECGKQITAEAVGYDGHANPSQLKTLYFHPACAALVGQRLICDGFPSRRKG